MKLKTTKICSALGFLFILSIPMQPIFTMFGYYTIAFFTCLISLLIIIKEHSFKFTKFEFMEILFIICMIFSLFIGGHIVERIKYVFGIIRHVIFIFFAIRLISYSEKNKDSYSTKIVVNKILDVFTLGTVIISIYILIFEPSSNGYYGRMGRVAFQGDYGGYITYSYNLIISIIWCLYKVLDKNTTNRKRYIIALIILLPCSLLNGTKKNIFSLALFFIIFIFLNSKNFMDKSLKMAVVLIIIVASYSVLMTNNYLHSLIGYRIEIYIKSLSSNYSGYVDSSTKERSLMREKAFEYFSKSPIYGNGISSFMYMFGDQYGVYLYSHNNYLEILSNLGLIGFALYYGWFIKCLLTLNKLRKIENTSLVVYMIAFMLTILILDYGTVSFDKIHYLLVLDVVSFYNLGKKEEGVLSD